MRIFAAGAVGMLGLAAIALAQDVQTPREGLLLLRDGPWSPAVFSEQQLAAESLCVRYNNYWCIKGSATDPWQHQTGRDERDHAIFDDASYGARAFFSVMRSYRFRHGLKTAREILNRYAPASDCVGSLPRNEGGVCPKGENPTLLYARRIATRAGVGVDDDLKLFNDDGTINIDVAKTLAHGFAQFELGDTHDVTDDLIVEGVKLAGIRISGAPLPVAVASGSLNIDRLPEDFPHPVPVRDVSTINMVVLHTIGGPKCAGDDLPFDEITGTAVSKRDWFTAQSGESIHYIVDREGRIAQQRPENRPAGHVSSQVDPAINARSIGIEMVNKGDGIEPFPEPQLAAVTALLRDIADRYGLGPDAIRTHAELDTRIMQCGNMSYPRRIDPGPLFPMDRIKAAVAGRP